MQSTQKIKQANPEAPKSPTARSLRKADTRARLIESADILFFHQGYQNSTLEEIAAHAGLHVQTLYRHFSNKQELATASAVQRLNDFREQISDPSRKTNSFQFWRAYATRSYEKNYKSHGREYSQHEVHQHQNPEMASQFALIENQYEDLLTEVLAKDFNMEPTGTGTPRLIATMLIGGYSHVVRRFYEDSTLNLKEEIEAMLDKVEKIASPFLADQPR